MNRIPPPMVGLAAFLVGVLLQRLVWPAIGSPSAPERWVGWTITVLGFLLVAGSVASLFAHRTTVVPHGTPSRLLVHGPFRWTRNPIYVGAITGYLGAAIALRQWVAVPLVALPLWFIVSRVIPMEEGALRAAFGGEYEQYCARVRRWL